MRGRFSHRLLLPLVLAVCLGAGGSAAHGVHAQSQARANTDILRAATAAIAHGRRDEAAKLAQLRPGSSDAAIVRAALLAHAGKYSDAIGVLRPLADADRSGAATVELGLLYDVVGRRADAEPLLTAVLQRGDGAADADSLLRAARAAQALVRRKDANALYRAAERAGGDPAVVETGWGTLFLATHNRPEAVKSFRAALTADPQWAPAQAGLARALQDDDPPAAAAAAAKALAIDPELEDAHLLLAELHLDEDREADARAEIGKVLAVNPSSLEAHAELAGLAIVHDDTTAFDREVAAALAVNPSYGGVYRIAGEQLASHYRFQEAADMARKALALDPASSRAAGDLSMHLMRTGDEPGARTALDQAFREDPYDVVTFNLLQLLDHLQKFVVVRDGEFVFKMDPAEAPVLREYAGPLARQAIAALSQRYDFTPAGPITVEIFPQHDDFAVRNLGLPGMIGALGACFGTVVTMDSPHARNQPGDFFWEATLWHELAHVVTLQLSHQRIPRWLTEGISVYEEGRARPEWDRDQEVQFAQAMNRGTVLKLRDLNAGFTRPDTVGLAYYEASLLVDHIVTTKGQPALRALVKSYADGIDTDAAVKRALGVSLNDLQRTFDQALEARFGGMRRALADPPPPPIANLPPLSILRGAAAAKPDSYATQLAYGRALVDAGDPAAYAVLTHAAALVPFATGAGSPHALMAALAEKQGDKARAVKEYEALLAVDSTNIDAARKLATLGQGLQDARATAIALDRVVALDPFDAEAHTTSGRVALSRRDPTVAVREFSAALAAGAPDKAAAHCDLGDALLLANRPLDAKKEALAALEIAPTFERAQDLLLKATGKAP